MSADDDLADRMLGVSADLAVSVEECDQERIDEILTALERRELYALAIVLAAHIDVDRPLTERRGPGFTAITATRLSGRRFEVTVEEILGRSRRREVTDARAVAMSACVMFGMTYSEIGRRFGRDHTTALHAFARVGADAHLRGIAEQVAQQLGRERPLYDATEEVA